MYRLLKPLLFVLSPEAAHQWSAKVLDIAAAISPIRALLRRWYFPKRAVGANFMGLHFPNKVGLAAGFDKDGKHLAGLLAFGFGFVEVGTVTPRPQAGNPAPRLFRLPKDQALINRMGFNNEGVEALAKRLSAWRQQPQSQQLVLGGNIGKNKDTPNERAAEDYLACFEILFPWVDYFVVNVSSPNTPGLRALQEKGPLTDLLNQLQAANRAKTAPKPILLKIAPDLTDEQLDDIADIVRDTQLAGVIATNTTLNRSQLRTEAAQIEQIGAGGLSGVPLAQRATEVVRYLRRRLGPDPVIIGVGGIHSIETARERMDAGANLVQVYSGLVYEGPGLVRLLATFI